MKAAAAMAAAANDNPLVVAPEERSEVGDGTTGTLGTTGVEALWEAEGRLAEADGVHE